MNRPNPARGGNARFRALCEALERRIVFNTTNPVIFHVTESAVAGQVVSLQGENFGTNAQLWIDRIDSSADAPDLEQQITRVLHRTSQLITAELPTNLQEGLYAVFVKNTETGAVSAARFINQTHGIQYLDLADNSVQQGETFRISGRNLDFAGSTTFVKFRNQATGAISVATVTQGNDPYIITVKAPGDLVDTQAYDVIISNGYGGSYSETFGPSLKGRTAGTDYWGLGTAWSSYYGFYNNVYNVKTDSRLAVKAVGDGVADDYAAIQAAINAANAAGGGVVYLPTGQYNANGHNFSMKSNVVLKGDGMNSSRIFDDSAVALGATGSLFSGGPANIGVVDLAIECGTGGFNSTWKVGGASSYRQFLLRSRFTNARKEVLVYGSHFMLVDGCQVIHTARSGKNVIDFSNRTYFIIRNSYIQWSDGRIDMLANAGNIQLENNTFSRSTASDAAALGYGGPSVGSANNVAMLNNTFNKLEPAGKLPKNNDGETIMNENIEYSGTGLVTGATDTTLSNSLSTWTVNSKANWEVTIVQGKGMGQTRKITANDATTLTLASAWDVNPDGTSSYAITKFDENYLIKGNLLQDVPRGIWVTYGGSMRDIAIVDNQLIDGQGIYLRGDTRSGGRFNVQTNIVVEGNTLINDKNWYPAQIVVSQVFVSGTELTGNSFYNVMIRDNDIKITGAALAGGGATIDDGSGAADGYYARQHNQTDNDTAGLFGVVFDHNTSTNLPTAYSVNSGAYETTIFNSVNNNVGQILGDATMTGATHASVNTSLTWTTDQRAVPIVGVTATAPTSTEGGAAGSFRFTRSGTAGDLTVYYTITGSASASDYSPVLTGSVVIANGQSYVDIPIIANDDLVYFESKETIKLTLTPNAGYEVGQLYGTVTVIDNDKTGKVLDVAFNGTGNGNGGAGDIVSAGGTAVVNTPAGGQNSITIGNANPMGGGNYANFNVTTLSDAAPSVTVTPTDADSSFAALARKVDGVWQLNGGFDFFVRRNSGGTVRLFNPTNSGGWGTFASVSGSVFRFVIDTPTIDLDQSVSTTFSAGQVYHVGVTFSTDPATGAATINFYKLTGTGAIDTTSATNRIFSTTWNPDDTPTKAFSSGAFNLGVIPLYWATASIDLDGFKLYNTTPTGFTGITGEALVTVAATDDSASQTGRDPGTFTLTRNNTVGALTVNYALGGTALAGSYTPSSLNSVTFADGQATATVTITPVGNASPTGTVTLTLTQSPSYLVGSQPQVITIVGGNAPPVVDSVTIGTGASSTTATSATLTAAVNDDAGVANLTYAWSVESLPADAVSPTFTATDASPAVTFKQAGTYTFTLTVTDTGGLTATQSATVTVNQALSSITLSPVNPSVVAGATQQFAATAKDQFGWAMSPALTWSVTGAGNQISNTGLFTAGTTAGGYQVTAASGAISGSAAVTVTAAPSPSLFTGSGDIGAVGKVGSDSLSNGTYTVLGSGADIWGSADAFRYVYKSFSGDGEIIARVASQQNTSSTAKSGVMIRESLNANSANVLVAMTPGTGATFQRRTTTGGSTSSNKLSGKIAPYWVKLTRTGNIFTGYASADGVTWTKINSATVTMGTNVYIGVAVSSHNNAVLNTSTFNNVSISSYANLSQGKSVTATSTAAGSSAANAVDGNAAAGWTSAATGTQSITVDLGATKKLERINLTWGTGKAASAFQIYYSKDGVTWTSLYSTTKGSGAAVDLTSLGITGRYVRLTATKAISTSYVVSELTVTGA